MHTDCVCYIPSSNSLLAFNHASRRPLHTLVSSSWSDGCSVTACRWTGEAIGCRDKRGSECFNTRRHDHMHWKPQQTVLHKGITQPNLEHVVHSDLRPMRLRQNLLVLDQSPRRTRLLLLLHLSADLRSTFCSMGRHHQVRNLMERRNLQLEAYHRRWRHERVYQIFLLGMRILHGYAV